MNCTDTKQAATHVFETAGLGKAPFRFVRSDVRLFQACPGDTPRAGSSCDYCGASIANVCWIQGSDGREFKVGCDCVAKTGDRGLKRHVDKLVSKQRREKAEDNCAAKVEAARIALAKDAVRATLAAKPSPTKRPGSSLLDYVEWCLDHAGRTGKTAAARYVLTAVEGR